MDNRLRKPEPIEVESPVIKDLSAEQKDKLIQSFEKGDLKTLLKLFEQNIDEREHEAAGMPVYDMEGMIKFNQHQGFTNGIKWVVDIYYQLKEDKEERIRQLEEEKKKKENLQSNK